MKEDRPEFLKNTYGLVGCFTLFQDNGCNIQVQDFLDNFRSDIQVIKVLNEFLPFVKAELDPFKNQLFIPFSLFLVLCLYHLDLLYSGL